ncbi:hypothetical protein [Streptomyces sp900116325]|uniref:hypothetical protein n=1 Tax=Streptomyces sp. 900116325 TaxID=3154295 RepID=UPI0033F9CE05
MRAEYDIDTSPPGYTACSAVRITPYADDSTLDLDQAVTIRFQQPVTFVYVRRTRMPPVGQILAPIVHPVTAFVGFTAPLDHDDQDLLDAIEHELRRHLGTTVAVEIWSHGGECLIIPRWRYRFDFGQYHEIRVRPGHTTCSIGEALAVDQPIHWASLGATIEPGTQLHMAIHAGPPPPASPLPASPLPQPATDAHDAPGQPGHCPDPVQCGRPRRERRSLRGRLKRLAHRKGWWYSPSLHYMGVDFGSGKTRRPKP